MTWLSLDPSSTRTGYAAWDVDRMLEAGTLRPDRVRDDVFVRINAMVRDLRGLVDGGDVGRVEVVVMEVPSGRVGRGARAGATGHLAIYGVAVGALWATCGAMGLEVVTTTERDWTRGVPARRRQAIVSASVRGYDAGTDSGADVSDAIGIGQWWIRERRRLVAVRGERS